MDLVKLKNGTEELLPLVLTVSLSIKDLFATAPFAAYDLVMMCRDKNYQPFGNNGDLLKELALVDSQTKVHASIQNIVLSGVIGEGFQMSWTDPRI